MHVSKIQRVQISYMNVLQQSEVGGGLVTGRRRVDPKHSECSVTKQKHVRIFAYKCEAVERKRNVRADVERKEMQRILMHIFIHFLTLRLQNGITEHI